MVERHEPHDQYPTYTYYQCQAPPQQYPYPYPYHTMPPKKDSDVKLVLAIVAVIVVLLVVVPALFFFFIFSQVGGIVDEEPTGISLYASRASSYENTWKVTVGRGDFGLYSNYIVRLEGNGTQYLSARLSVGSLNGTMHSYYDNDNDNHLSGDDFFIIWCGPSVWNGLYLLDLSEQQLADVAWYS